MTRLLHLTLFVVCVLFALPVQAGSLEGYSRLPNLGSASQEYNTPSLAQPFPHARAGALEDGEQRTGVACAPSPRKGEAQLAQAHRAEQAGGWGLTLPEWFQNPPTLYFHSDHLGSTQFASNDEQVLTQHEEYFPSGEPWRSETDSKYELARRYVFAGKELDIHTGLFDYGARQYDARMGVWLSPDPILASMMQERGVAGVTEPSNLWLYTNSRNNLVNLTDQDGRSWWSKAIKVAYKVGSKGFDLASAAEAFADNIQDVKTVLDPNASVGDRLLAAASLASEALPVSGSDVKDAARVLEKVGVDGNTLKKGVEAIGAGVDKVKAKAGAGPYAHLPDHPSVGPGKGFTQTQKKKFLSENEKANGGILRDDVTGEQLVRPQQHKAGVRPPDNEAHIDHVDPRSKGGSNSSANANVRSRKNNLEKSDK